jgi:hypothetical protein
MNKHQRFRLSQGADILVQTYQGTAPEPVAAKQEFEAGRKYPILLKGSEAGHGTVERDESGALWVIPDFEVAIDKVEFNAFWQIRGDKAVLTRIVLQPRS